MKRRQFFQAVPVIPAILMLPSCGMATALALLTAIVAAAEVVIDSPVISGLDPATAQQIINDANQVLSIVTNLIDNGITPTTIAQAITQLSALLPQIPQLAGTPAGAIISALLLAVQAFLTAYQTNPMTFSASEIAKYQPQLQQLSGRAHQAMSRVGAARLRSRTNVR